MRILTIASLIACALMSAVVVRASDTPTPEEMVSVFFDKIGRGAFEEAYKEFVGPDFIKEKPQTVQTLISQTSAAFALYGKIISWERVDEGQYGQYLKRMRYLMNTKYPVAWEFYFWKSKGGWMVVNVRFADQPEAVFH